MERKAKRVPDPRAVAIIGLIDREVNAHCDPEATFEQRQEIAEAVVAEVVARLRRGDPGEG